MFLYVIESFSFTVFAINVAYSLCVCVSVILFVCFFVLMSMYLFVFLSHCQFIFLFYEQCVLDYVSVIKINLKMYQKHQIKFPGPNTHLYILIIVYLSQQREKKTLFTYIQKNKIVYR